MATYYAREHLFWHSADRLRCHRRRGGEGRVASQRGKLSDTTEIVRQDATEERRWSGRLVAPTSTSSAMTSHCGRLRWT